MDVSAAVTCGCSACMSLAMVVGQSWSCAGWHTVLGFSGSFDGIQGSFIGI